MSTDLSTLQYGVSSDAYLARAKSRLEENTPASLFYAAFELRCYVETRQDDYINAQKEYAKSIPKAYKIGVQGKVLERIFDNKQIQFFAFSISDNEVFECYHVPVSPKLRKEAEWLGNLLHAQMKFHLADDPWWLTVREKLLAIYRLAWTCAQGNLPSPLFMVDGNTIGNIEIHGDEEYLANLMTLLKPGAKGTFRVDYLKSPPAHWRCDL